MSVETGTQHGSLVEILDGPAVASGNELKQWYASREGNSYPYHEVREASRRVSGLLQEQGVEPGDRVILWGKNSPQWDMALFGVLRSGATSVPFDVNADSAFFEKVVEATSPRAIIAGSEQQESLRRDFGIPVLPMEDAHRLHGQEVDVYSDADISSTDLAQIVFTSGSTGNPKGVMLSHGNIRSNVEAVAEVVPLDPENRLLSILPLSHMFEFSAGMLIPMERGASIVYVDTIRPDTLRQAMQDEGITGMAVVPQVLKLFHDSIENQAAKGSKLKRTVFSAAKRVSPHLSEKARRAVFREIHEKMGGNFHFFFVGGAKVDPELADYWENLGVQVLQGYGMTEASPVVTCDRPDEERGHQYAGTPIPGVEVRIASDGEILVKGPGIMQGYWNNPEATANSLDGAGWYHTDDLGEMVDGRLKLNGRKGDLIVLPNGMNVYPDDLQLNLLKQNEGIVRDVVVFDRGDGDIHAVILLAEGVGEVDLDSVIRSANHNQPTHLRVKSARVWREKDFPRTPARKIKRKEVIREVVDQQA